MKRLIALLMMLAVLFTGALAEALPVTETEITFADLVKEENTQVAGPQMSKLFIENYVRENPDIIWEIFPYLEVYDLVQHFTELYPEAENYNTYDALTGEVKNLEEGYCVTFHQNLAADDPFGGYTPWEYAAMCAIAVRELDADGVNIGYYGNAEVSFTCLDKETAFRFAIRHNQHSVYCVQAADTAVNPLYDGSLNPIEGVE